MKQIIAILFVASLFLVNCKDQKEQKDEIITEEVSPEVVELEKETDVIEAQTKELETAEAELDSALEALDF